MARPSTHLERVYPTYKPYPVSWDFRSQPYGEPGSENSRNHLPPPSEGDPFSGFLHLAEQSSLRDWQDGQPRDSIDEASFRPLRLLRSLFSDRLDLLNATLRELEVARNHREKMTAAALEDIDSHIEECDRSLGLLKGHKVLDDFEKRRHLERQLLELNRQRRQEAVLSWRDLLALDREIRALRREIDSLGRTRDAAENREALL